jgi:hypothetical protein
MYGAARALPLLLAPLLLPIGWAAAGPLNAAPREAATAAGGAADPLANEPPELVARLRAQKLVLLEEVRPRSPGGGDFFVAYVIFEQPLGRVFELLAQPTRQREYRPELEAMVVVARGEDELVVEQRMRVMFVPLVYRLRHRLDREAGRVSWALDPGFENSLRRVEGYWELFELDGDRTLGRFGTLVDVGPALPRSFQDVLTRRTVLRSVESCRRWVDSGGTWRP